jgi:hypothetical protein
MRSPGPGRGLGLLAVRSGAVSSWNGHHAWDGHSHDYGLVAVCCLCWCTRASLGMVDGWAYLTAMRWSPASVVVHSYEARVDEPWLDAHDRVRPLTAAEREQWELLGSLPDRTARKRRERKRLSKLVSADV